MSSTLRAALAWIAAGAAFGLALAMLSAGRAAPAAFAPATIAFIAITPFVLGWVSVCGVVEPPAWVRIVAPLVSAAIATGLAIAVAGQTIFGAALALPWTVVLAAVGGVASTTMHDVRARIRAALVLSVATVVAMPIESRVGVAAVVRTNADSVLIAAPPSAVWEAVVQVDSIGPAERVRALYSRLGLPPQVSTTLEHPRAGSRRYMQCEGGAERLEIVTAWLDEEQFRVEPADQGTLIAGKGTDPSAPYFTDGAAEFDLEPVGDTATRLTTRHAYRVATHLNAYVGWWADTVMRSRDAELLHIIKTRAERAARERTPALTAAMRELESALIARADTEARTYRDAAAAVGAHGFGLIDEAMILTGDGRPESVGGVSIPYPSLTATVDESLRNVLKASAPRARATAWTTSYGSPSGDQATLRFEFEDRAGRCVAVARTASVGASGGLVLGARRLSRCDVRVLADVIRRGRRLARIPFDYKGLDVIFTTVGNYPGTVDVYFDSVVVTVRGARLQTKLLEGHPQNVDSITTSLAYHSGSSWGPGKQSNAVKLQWPARDGDVRDIPRMRFTIPRDSSESLSDRWVVFSHHLTVPKTASNPYGIAWTYAHLSDTMFKRVPGTR